MSKKIDLFRIKLNGRSVIKLSKVKSERDYIFSIPPLVQDSVEANTHFTFHTPNNRLTFKVTTAKQNSGDIMPEILEKIKDHDVYKSKVTRDKVTDEVKDFDFYGDNGGRILNLEPAKMERIPSISFNLKALDWDKFFSVKQKTSDNEFIYAPLNLGIDESTAEGFTLHGLYW